MTTWAPVLVIMAMLVSSFGQILLKKSAGRSHANRWREYFNPLLFSAYGLFTLVNFTIVYCYRYIPLSLGPILQSTGYLFITLNGAVFLGEKITWRKVLGLATILLGVAVFVLG